MCDQTKTGHSLLSLANHPHHQDQDARNVQTVQQEPERPFLTERRVRMCLTKCTTAIFLFLKKGTRAIQV
ncbi:hypothetical protein PAHAL_4G296000 [Panicum hallii]|uniref:Uncharacterized protein n=1 Tax=Panicum hallii TaxID=206008 RepID=A0A2T8JEB6_9POAL|nr:hypothetical protein PAHAL_4G296000 [Panicum hallii]